MKENICKFIANTLGIDINKIEMDTHLINDLDLDSFTLVNLIGDLEDEFDVFFTEGEINSIQTVGDIVNYIEENS
ncbi:MAG: acyl carrier protein [Agathobacter sp.]|nr:acyl carrier protein [Agathobacter sp.]